jgi:hypothetical protein
MLDTIDPADHAQYVNVVSTAASLAISSIRGLVERERNLAEREKAVALREHQFVAKSLGDLFNAARA